MRHAVAHITERALDTDGVQGPLVHSGMQFGAGKFMFENVLKDREFMNTMDGQIQSYEISQTSLDALAAIRVEFYSAFAEAERLTAATAAALRAAPNAPGSP